MKAYEDNPIAIKKETLDTTKHMSLGTDGEANAIQEALAAAPGVYMSTRKEPYQLGEFAEVLMTKSDDGLKGDRLKAYNSKMRDQLQAIPGCFLVDDIKAIFVHIVRNLKKEQLQFFMSELIFLCMFDEALAVEISGRMNFVPYGGTDRSIQRQWDLRQAQQQPNKFVRTLLQICNERADPRIVVVFT